VRRREQNPEAAAEVGGQSQGQQHKERYPGVKPITEEVWYPGVCGPAAWEGVGRGSSKGGCRLSLALCAGVSKTLKSLLLSMEGNHTSAKASTLTPSFAQGRLRTHVCVPCNSTTYFLLLRPFS
jgi:hypothetical protein